ncbi:transcription factor HIVEP3 isoform X2 [Linepithema humile]|uniref:transcription factor HIVEP3 isoform X2 n=1 Tax=Linepithema humile TaxID=83485 RepID=UPI0006232E12|nr:PREDICTED: transcription factor HIVEP3 isoform X2 [Linepithema humile]
MTTETHTVAMTDPQLTNNNNNNNNNNNDGEPKYLHKKFKKMATTEVAPKVVEPRKEATANNVVPAETPKRKDANKDGKESSKEPGNKLEASTESEGPEPTTESRKSGYLCPYCQMACAKPSVLQKHIRAHTNERPYPCVPCGFAFKTKSNLYKHCRSRSHAHKTERGDKMSEDSDISLSDSASNGTGTPPPPPASTPTATTTTVSTVALKTVKTGKIYKPKFQARTALQCVNSDTETSSLSPSSSSSSSSSSTTTSAANSVKPNAEQLQEHIDKIITDNQAIVDAVDPRLHKLMQRQQSLVETKQSFEQQPLNLSSAEESANNRKRCYSDSCTQEAKEGAQSSESGSIIKDLLLKTRDTAKGSLPETAENFVCPTCNISFTSIDNLEAHRRYYCKGIDSPRRGADYQIELEKRDSEFDSKPADYYGTLQPLTSPGPLLGNTRLVDAYAPPAKKQRTESVPTNLRSLEELSKYPRPNSLQMFGGEVRILDNTGETKTMRIEPRQTNSPTNENIVNSKCVTSETASIVVRSGLHSGGTMVHKPPGTPASTPSSSISLPNTPKILAPIIPNISTPNIAPTMSCYNYLEQHLNPLTSITAYNPLTLPQAGVTSILHGGKVIPYVPGMPGPHTLTGTPTIDISPSITAGEASYKVIPGLPGLHMISQPLDLASPVKAQPSTVPGIPSPLSGHASMLDQPLDLASPAKESTKISFKTPSSDGLRSGMTSPKVPSVKIETSTDKYRARMSSTPTGGENNKAEFDPSFKNKVAVVRYKNMESPREKREFTYDKSPKLDKAFSYPNGVDSAICSISYSKLKYSPKTTSESRKRQSNWGVSEVDAGRTAPIDTHVASTKYDLPPHENGRLKISTSSDVRAWTKVTDGYGAFNGAKPKADNAPSVILVNLDSSKTEVPTKTFVELVVKDKQPEAKSPKSSGSETTVKETTNKFLRPTSLPLKPGTFTPKKHHGITPTANTLPLISPETPRPKKSYGQLYLNGHAYTYLGLKCSTRVFYCTLNRPQPMYVTQQHGLSMYSNWKICKEAPPDVDMAHYDSRHIPLNYTTAWKKQEDILTHSSQRPTTPSSPDSGLESDIQEKAKRVKIFDGGFESNEDYTYVRGRGRGRYVCEECGIRCKKPSMLKKHIRTHTDVRPYTCKHCAFSFKTKGNLTKHMKSKAHYKKCVELGVVPIPTSVCDENIDKEAIARLAAGGGNAEESSEEEEETDGEESEESGSEEQEAAQSLLSLSQRNTMNRLPGLLPSNRPTTYPYALTLPTTSTVNVVSTVTSTTAISSQSITTQGTALIQNDLSHRYYFPSTRSIAEESRMSVIQSSKKDESDFEIEEITDVAESRHQPSQPIDLTTKQNCAQLLSSPIPQRVRPVDILTPVSEPVLLQTIVQTMERLPRQGREWKPDAEGQMLQAYLTERYVMDSKIKQQYRVGNTKLDNKQVQERDIYPRHQESSRPRYIDSNSIPTVTYTDPSKMQHTVMESRVKYMTKHTSDDIKMEIREKIYQNNMAMERRTFDYEIHKDKEHSSRPVSERENFELGLTNGSDGTRPSIEYGLSVTKNNNSMERSIYSIDAPVRSTPNIDCHSPKSLNIEANNRPSLMQHVNNDIDRSSMFNTMKMMNEIERSRDCHSVGQEMRSANHEMRTATSDVRMQNQSPRNLDLRPPSRTPGQEYRTQNQELRLPSQQQEYKIRGQEMRPPSREYKPPFAHDMQVIQELMPSTNMEMRQTNSDNRPPSSDMRPLAEYRTQPPDPRANYEIMQSAMMHESTKLRNVDARNTLTQDVRHIYYDAKHTEAAKQNTSDSMKHTVARIDGRNTLAQEIRIVYYDAKRTETAKQDMPDNMKHAVARNMVVGGPDFRLSPNTGNSKPQAEFLQPSNGPMPNYVSVTEDGRSVCDVCNKVFSKPSQLRLHINIHYFERPYRCESCAVSFRSKGHLTKHERSVTHQNKVSMTSTFGAATTSNPRPFKCTDCKIAFRIHGHLAKHLRSKMHIMKLECVGKLPFGTYAEMERSGVNLNDIDTTDCDNSLNSLQILAQRLYEKDPTKITQWDSETMPGPAVSGSETSSDEGEPIPQHALHTQYVKASDAKASRSYHVPTEEPKAINDVRLRGPLFNQQRREYTVKEQRLPIPAAVPEDARAEDNLQSYKCQACPVSMRTVNELQVHCFAEHNIETDSSTNIHADRSAGKCSRDKENTQKRITEESAIQEERSRQRTEDT